MKKLVLVAVIMTALLFGLIGCSGKKNNTGGSNNNYTDEQLLAFSSATLGNMLQATEPAVSAKGIRKMSLDKELVEEKLSYYLQMIDGFIAESPVKSEEKISDKAEYENLLQITLTGIDGEAVVYNLYYNQQLVIEDEDIDEDTDTETEDDEKEYIVDGILICGEIEYTVSGKREVEEGEYEFSFKASLDENNYIMFEQEVEEDEQEFCYAIYQDGKCVNRFSLDIEKEEDETYLKLKTNDSIGKLDIKFTQKINDDETYIKCIIKEGTGKPINVRINITTNEETGEKQYEYRYN